MRTSPSHDLAQSQDEQQLSDWMRKSQKGDSEAYRLLLGRLVVLVRSNVQNSLKRMGFSDHAAGEDIVQEILLAIHNKRDSYDPEQFFLPWLYAIARYKVIDFARQARRSKTQPFEETDVLLHQGPVPADWTNERIDFKDEIQKLPKKQREVLRLAKVEGLSLEEISIQTGFSLSDVKVNVHRAIKRLRKSLKGSHPEN